MKKVVLMAMVAIFALSFTLEAQNNQRNRRESTQDVRTESRWTAKDRAEVMKKQLELTEDEAAKVQTLFEKQDADRAEQVAAHRTNRERATGDREARRKEMQAAREKAVAENDAELEKIIGKEKVEQWKQIREERQKAVRDVNRQGRRPTLPAPR